MTAQTDTCRGRADEPPHYLRTHQCSRRATTERTSEGASMPLCTQHARMVDRHGAHLLLDWFRDEAEDRRRWVTL